MELAYHLNIAFFDLLLYFGLGFALLLLFSCVPVIKGFRRFEYFGDEKVHEAPQLMKIVLQWGAGKQQFALIMQNPNLLRN